MRRRARKGPIEGRARERDHVHVPGARRRAARGRTRRPSRPSCRRRRPAPGGAGRREPRTRRARCAGARVASSPRCGTHAARATHERHDRQLPPARRARPPARPAGRRRAAGARSRTAGTARERVDRRPRQLVRDQRRGQPRRARSRRASSAATRPAPGRPSQSAERAVVNQRSRLHARQAATASAVGAPQRAHSGAASGAQLRAAALAHPLARRGGRRRSGAAAARRTSEASEGMAPG